MDFNILKNEKIGHIKSVGDKVPLQTLDVIHSRFDEVINFIVEEHLVSIVSPKIDAGPFRIVLDNFNLADIFTARLTLDELRVNHRYIFSRDRARLYNSTLKPELVDSHLLPEHIKRLKHALSESDIDKSLCYLLRQDAKPANLSIFETELFEQLGQAYSKLVNNDILGAVLGFKGRGYGQTPSGDDFNTGFLLGLTIREHYEKKELSNIRSSVYTHSLGKNLLVNTFLLQAYHGWLNENWNILLSGLSGETANLESSIQDILAQGETSGADTLTGFISAWDVT